MQQQQWCHGLFGQLARASLSEAHICLVLYHGWHPVFHCKPFSPHRTQPGHAPTPTFPLAADLPNGAGAISPPAVTHPARLLQTQTCACIMPPTCQPGLPQPSHQHRCTTHQKGKEELINRQQPVQGGLQAGVTPVGGMGGGQARQGWAGERSYGCLFSTVGQPDSPPACSAVQQSPPFPNLSLLGSPFRTRCATAACLPMSAMLHLPDMPLCSLRHTPLTWMPAPAGRLGIAAPPSDPCQAAAETQPPGAPAAGAQARRRRVEAGSCQVGRGSHRCAERSQNS